MTPGLGRFRRPAQERVVSAPVGERRREPDQRPATCRAAERRAAEPPAAERRAAEPPAAERRAAERRAPSTERRIAESPSRRAPSRRAAPGHGIGGEANGVAAPTRRLGIEEPGQRCCFPSLLLRDAVI